MLEQLTKTKEYLALNDKDRKLALQYMQYLDSFALEAVIKFCRGRAEHKEGIETINCHKEIGQELMDLIAYRFISTDLQFNNKK